MGLSSWLSSIFLGRNRGSSWGHGMTSASPHLGSSGLAVSAGTCRRHFICCIPAGVRSSTSLVGIYKIVLILLVFHPQFPWFAEAAADHFIPVRASHPGHFFIAEPRPTPVWMQHIIFVYVYQFTNWHVFCRRFPGHWTSNHHLFCFHHQPWRKTVRKNLPDVRGEAPWREMARRGWWLEKRSKTGADIHYVTTHWLAFLSACMKFGCPIWLKPCVFFWGIPYS